MRLLVVEDEKDLNRIIVKELESEGYLVDSCFDGESAFDYLCMAEYDGVILDIMIPRMDGFTILKKARGKGIATPVLFLSAKSDVNDIVHGLDLGADDYMVKPFELKELLARIRMITRKKVDVHENIYTCGTLTVNCNGLYGQKGRKADRAFPKGIFRTAVSDSQSQHCGKQRADRSQYMGFWTRWQFKSRRCVHSVFKKED